MTLNPDLSVEKGTDTPSGGQNPKINNQ